MRFVHDNRIMLERRRELRKNPTKAEEILWFELRNSKLGDKFKRQHSIGGYVTDFYCQKYKLIIELDGEIHNMKEAKEHDKIRDSYLEEQGYKVLRFSNSEVEDGVEKVLEKIKNHSQQKPPNRNRGVSDNKRASRIRHPYQLIHEV